MSKPRVTCYIVRRTRNGRYDQLTEYATLREARAAAARIGARVYRAYGPRGDRGVGEQV